MFVRRIALMVAVVAFAIAAGPPTRSARGQDVEAPRGVWVSVASTPVGAAVRVDDTAGAPIGITPIARVSIARGWHTLYLNRAGYVPYELRAQVDERSHRFSVVLVRSCRLRIDATSTGAAVMLDGEPIGTTPLDVDGLRAGTHTIEVSADGMQPYRANVMLAGGRVTTVHVPLIPRDRPPQ